MAHELGILSQLDCTLCPPLVTNACRGITQRYPAAGRSGGDAGAALRLSSDFQTTPLFTVATTDADGRATVKFTAPANLGAFSVRAYVVSKGVEGQPSRYGANETELVVRLPVSLTPALPRCVRCGAGGGACVGCLRGRSQNSGIGALGCAHGGNGLPTLRRRPRRSHAAEANLPPPGGGPPCGSSPQDRARRRRL